MDGYHKHAGGGEHVTYDRLRAMGTNGVQEPCVGFKDGKLVGTPRLFTDGKFGTKDGKAHFKAAKWRGLQAKGREAQRDKYAFLINNGRKNMIWQNAFYDVRTPFVRERFPAPPIEMNPDDMKELGLGRRPGRDHQQCGLDPGHGLPHRDGPGGRSASCCSARPWGQVGNVISEHTKRADHSHYKNVWANIRRIGRAPEADQISFKALEIRRAECQDGPQGSDLRGPSPERTHAVDRSPNHHRGRFRPDVSSAWAGPATRPAGYEARDALRERMHRIGEGETLLGLAALGGRGIGKAPMGGHGMAGPNGGRSRRRRCRRR